MSKLDKDFSSLIEIIRSTNGLTKKTSERLLIDLINNHENLDQFIEVLKIIKNEYKICETCFYFKVDGVCEICSNTFRDQKTICVVTTIADVINIEKNGKYKGLYAVLGGEINLVKSISPDQLKIEQIFNRANQETELILALNTTFEGEVTANYIAQLAKKQNIKVSRIAKGIPMGGVLDYMDETTLESAFNNRKNYGGK